MDLLEPENSFGSFLRKVNLSLSISFQRVYGSTGSMCVFV